MGLLQEAFDDLYDSFPDEALETTAVVNYEMLHRMAENGSSDAQAQLGTFYKNGSGDLAADPEQALYWLKRAAEQTNAQAMNNLACMYWVGQGVTRDTKEALRLWNLATVQNCLPSLYNAGQIYLTGKSVPPNPTRALSLLQRAADLDHPSSLFLLGCCYQEGEGVLKDSALGLEYLIRAADLGCVPAMRNAGLSLNMGISGAFLDPKKRQQEHHNRERAEEYLQMATDNGDPFAAHFLFARVISGVRSFGGRYVPYPPNAKRAKKILRCILDFEPHGEWEEERYANIRRQAVNHFSEFNLLMTGSMDRYLRRKEDWEERHGKPYVDQYTDSMLLYEEDSPNAEQSVETYEVEPEEPTLKRERENRVTQTFTAASGSQQWGELVFTLRKQAGFTQKQLARMIGKDEKTIRRIESGEGNPKVDTVQDIIDATGAKLTALLDFDKK